MKDSILIRKLVSAILKTRKLVRIYPENHPVYINSIDSIFGNLTDILTRAEDIVLHIKHYEVLFNNEQVYHNTEKYNNFALLFFKDGIRALTFKKGLRREELETFLRVISVDERELVDEDMAILLWEKDFQHIKYIADDTVLEGDAEYETAATSKLMEQPTSQEEIETAHNDALTAEDTKAVQIAPLSESDLTALGRQIEKDADDKLNKIVNIVLELFHQAMKEDEFDETVSCMKSIMETSVNNGDAESVLVILKKVKGAIGDADAHTNVKVYLRKVIDYAGSYDFIKLLGAAMEGKTGKAGIEDDILDNFVKYLDAAAIHSFIKVLGELQKIRPRKAVIKALSALGRNNMHELATGLNDDRWYVVRNIIYAMKLTRNADSVEHALKAIRHPDIRVRKEAIKMFGEFKASHAISALKECLNDPSEEVRLATARALGHIRTEAAKHILIQHILLKKFIYTDYKEKKYFFETLSAWRDKDAAGAIIEALKKDAIFRKNKIYENRACAAYALGLMGDKMYLPLLKRYAASSNAFFQGHVIDAIRRLEGLNA